MFSASMDDFVGLVHGCVTELDYSFLDNVFIVGLMLLFALGQGDNRIEVKFLYGKST